MRPHCNNEAVILSIKLIFPNANFGSTGSVKLPKIAFRWITLKPRKYTPFIAAIFTCIFIAVLDALGKLGSGLLLGNLFWPGSFSECEGMKKFQYCLAGFNLKVGVFSKEIVNVSTSILLIFHFTQSLAFASCSDMNEYTR